jgi:3-oxoacyl-[acyl-carrier-protein] synthase-3
MITRSNGSRVKGVGFLGTGMATPSKVLANDDLAKFVDTNDEWITQRTGIKQRCVVENGTTVLDLAKVALTNAIQSAGIQPTDLNMVICATLTPEMTCPSTAARLVSEVGAVPAGAVDVSAACSGWVHGLNMASALIESGHYKTIAVVGAETLSKVTDWTDRRTCVLFGDGAGAAIISANDDPQRGCLFQNMGSNGHLWKELYLPRHEEHVPSDASFSGNLNTLQMNGREVYKFAVTTMQKSIEEALQACGVEASDLAMIVPHQSNMRILESTRERLGLPKEKLYINIDRYGNTSAASVPICMHELWSTGQVKPGNLVLFVALGGGLSWSSSLWRV